MKSANTSSGSSHRDTQIIDKEEVLDFRANYLLDLPLDTSLVLRVPGLSEEIVWTTRNLDKPRQPSERIWFDREEVHALISASESERAWPNDFREWCWMKRESPNFVIDAETTLSGAQPTKDRNWNVGRILDRLGIDLVSVAVFRVIEKEDGSISKAALAA